MSFHSIITLRASDYAPPDTEGIKFATSCLRIFAVNRRCSLDLSDCTFLHWILLFCTHQRLPFQGPIPPIRGKCPEGTKGVGMLSPKVTERLSQICCDLSVSASPSHLPWKGRLWDRACQGFPYEGKAFFCYIHSGRISMPCLAAKRRVEAVPPGVPSKTEMRREALCTMARLRRSMQSVE